jgi:hypothetical protein
MEEEKKKKMIWCTPEITSFHIYKETSESSGNVSDGALNTDSGH